MSYNKFRGHNDEDGDEEEASWQDSYSDLVTDLLAVFVILFAFAMMSQAIEVQKIEAIGKDVLDVAIANDLHANGESEVDAEGDGDTDYEGSGNGEGDFFMSADEQNFSKLYESIKLYIEENGLSNELSVTNQENKQILLRVSASVFFSPLEADISQEADQILQSISQIFTDHNRAIKMIRIEGHTDNLPTHTAEFDSNWELSTARAVNVLRRLLNISAIEPTQLSAVGYGEYYPVTDNDTQDGRLQNRRVDFVIEAIDYE